MPYKNPDDIRRNKELRKASGVTAAYNRDYYIKNVEDRKNSRRVYYKENSKEILVTQRLKYKENPLPFCMATQRWSIKNLRQRAATQALRKARQLQATPKWLTKEQLEEIKQFYINCPEGYEVDHIHPLQGRGFCGLHVPWNLQYLTASENRHKYNHLT